MDPIPVLESFEKSQKRRKGKTEDEESLESLVEKSNQNPDRALAVKEPGPDTSGEIS
jgi:hypothetical protein